MEVYILTPLTNGVPLHFDWSPLASTTRAKTIHLEARQVNNLNGSIYQRGRVVQ